MSDFAVESLRDVVAAYARGVDRRDVGTFLGAFHPDATLVVERDGAASDPMRGHDELARVIDRIARYESTHHQLGQMAFAVEGDNGTGEVYCTASHLRRHDGGSEGTVMYIRYLDEYRWDDSRWAIQQRRVVVDWTDVRPVLERS